MTQHTSKVLEVLTPETEEQDVFFASAAEEVDDDDILLCADDVQLSSDDLLFQEAFAPMTPKRLEAIKRDIYLEASMRRSGIDAHQTVPLSALTPARSRPPTRKREWFGVGECVFVLLSMLILLSGVIFVRYALDYPHAIVWLTPVSARASVEATIPGEGIVRLQKTVPLSETRDMTPTGHGHQNASFASGTLSLYNANPSEVPVSAGTRIADFVTDETVTIPAAVPPAFGIMHVRVHALSVGEQDNIAAGTINGPCCNLSGVYARNIAGFSGGARARDFLTVTSEDLDRLHQEVTDALQQDMGTAFVHQANETLSLSPCVPTFSASAPSGQEATEVSLSGHETCTGTVYRPDLLQAQASSALARTRPAPAYDLAGPVATTLHTLDTHTIKATVSGIWVYRLTPAFERLLASQIAGKSASDAYRLLLASGIVTQASLSLPQMPADPDYISFIVEDPA